MARIAFYVLIPCLALSFTRRPLAEWSISEDYEIRFSGSGAEGTFCGLAGTIIFDPNDLSNSKFDVSVQANTIETGNKTKNKHARGKSWFDVENYPVITFVSTEVNRTNEGYELKGDLELHGAKKEVVIPFAFTEDGNSSIFEGKFIINRKDFNIKGPLLGFVVGDDFEVTLKVPVQLSPDR